MVVPHLQFTFELLQLSSPEEQSSSCECLASSSLAIIGCSSIALFAMRGAVACKVWQCRERLGCCGVWRVRGRVVVQPQGVVQRLNYSGSSYGLEFRQESPVDFLVRVAREMLHETFCSPL